MSKFFWIIESHGNYMHQRDTFEHWSSQIDGSTLVKFESREAADAFVSGRRATSQGIVKAVLVEMEA